MNKLLTTGKGQLSIEASVVLLFILILLPTLWLGGPIQQSTEKSTDTNGVILAQNTLNSIAANAEMAWMSGPGARKDFAVHIPFNTVDIEYGISNYTETGTSDWKIGPHINFSVLFYNPLPNDQSQPYNVTSSGDPSWFGTSDSTTVFYYKTITKGLKFPLEKQNNFPLCNDKVRKNSTDIRGPGTIFKFVTSGGQQRPIPFCCEAGFNLNLYFERDYEDSNLNLAARSYFNQPKTWNLADA
jgi:uncharacterized protein (UPF0333 family)